MECTKGTILEANALDRAMWDQQLVHEVLRVLPFTRVGDQEASWLRIAKKLDRSRLVCRSNETYQEMLEKRIGTLFASLFKKPGRPVPILKSAVESIELLSHCMDLDWPPVEEYDKKHHEALARIKNYFKGRERIRDRELDHQDRRVRQKLVYESDVSTPTPNEEPIEIDVLESDGATESDSEAYNAAQADAHNALAETLKEDPERPQRIALKTHVIARDIREQDLSQYTKQTQSKEMQALQDRVKQLEAQVSTLNEAQELQDRVKQLEAQISTLTEAQELQDRVKQLEAQVSTVNEVKGTVDEMKRMFENNDRAIKESMEFKLYVMEEGLIVQLKEHERSVTEWVKTYLNEREGSIVETAVARLKELNYSTIEDIGRRLKEHDRTLVERIVKLHARHTELVLGSVAAVQTKYEAEVSARVASMVTRFASKSQRDHTRLLVTHIQAQQSKNTQDLASQEAASHEDQQVPRTGQPGGQTGSF